MEKEFVPYELALKMKQLGFDEPCFGYYEDNNLTITFPSTSSNGWKWVGNSIIPAKNTNAPLFQQAFRWFREKYDLHNGIYPYYDEYEFQIKDFRLPTNTPIHGGLMKYEEAELECLKKLIEIVEQSKSE
jgi:hypothetical protein